MTDHPTDSRRRVVDDFDHMSEEFAKDPHGAFKDLRERCPVSYSEKHGGHWLLTRYDDVATALKNDDAFSSARPAGTDGVAVHIPSMPAPVQIPIEMDPPDSLKYRRALHPFLSPAAVDARAPKIRQHVARCVDAFVERGEADLIEDLASLAPAYVIIDMIGLPLDYAPRFSVIMHSITSHTPHTPPWEQAVADIPWMIGVIKEAVAGARNAGEGTLLNSLATATVDGEPIQPEIIESMIMLLIGGGVDTTTSLSGQAFMWLYHNPDKREWLRHNLNRLRWISEEFLRHSSPVTTQARTCVREIEVGGQVLQPGERVLLCLASANHDPEQFPNPDEINFDRDVNRHLAFGVGTHRCIGSNLARATFEAMVVDVLTRLPDYRVDERLATLYPAQGLVNGYVRLPVTFTPGPRADAR